jgi:hypothetical protein
MLDTIEARALITTSLEDDDLTDVITREEAWLARRIGPLEGSRVELFAPTDGDEKLLLARPALTVLVDDDSGAVTDYDLRGWGDVVRTAGSWSGEVTVTYTPSDDDEVRRVLISLVRLTLGERAFTAEAAQGYSYSASQLDQRQQRYTAMRSLMRPRRPSSLRLTSAIALGGVSLRSIAVTSGS